MIPGILDSQLEKKIIAGRTQIERGPRRRPISEIRAAKMSDRQITRAAVVEKPKMGGESQEREAKNPLRRGACSFQIQHR